jgi:hypothetical protein
LTQAERQVKEQLLAELLKLRASAMRSTSLHAETGVVDPTSSGYWAFQSDRPVTIVCAQLPREMLERIPYSDPSDPDYVALYSYADLDALFELYGHLKAVNPGSTIRFKTAKLLESNDYKTHLVSLGGVDWNDATRSLLGELRLPVLQVADWQSPDGPYFEVQDPKAADAARASRFHPVLSESGGMRELREDVALFARAVSPFENTCTVTICNGMYARGTLGAVRALTDEPYAQRNTDYAREKFRDSTKFCLITRVRVHPGATITPDWTEPENLLFEWKI